MPPPTRIVAENDSRVSDKGAKIAAGRIGCTVEEYRAHEAAGERWCALGEHWSVKRNADRCRPCENAYQRRRYVPQRAHVHVEGLRNVRYAGPAFSLTARGAAAATTVSDTAWSGRCAQNVAAAPSGHSNCPPSIRHLCLGQLPAGWVRERKEAAG